MGHLHVLGTPPRTLHMVNSYRLYMAESHRLLWGKGDHWYAQPLIFSPVGDAVLGDYTQRPGVVGGSG